MAKHAARPIAALDRKRLEVTGAAFKTYGPATHDRVWRGRARIKPTLHDRNAAKAGQARLTAYDCISRCHHPRRGFAGLSVTVSTGGVGSGLRCCSGIADVDSSSRSVSPT